MRASDLDVQRLQDEDAEERSRPGRTPGSPRRRPRAGSAGPGPGRRRPPTPPGSRRRRCPRPARATRPRSSTRARAASCGRARPPPRSPWSRPWPSMRSSISPSTGALAATSMNANPAAVERTNGESGTDLLGQVRGSRPATRASSPPFIVISISGALAREHRSGTTLLSPPPAADRRRSAPRTERRPRARTGTSRGQDRPEVQPRYWKLRRRTFTTDLRRSPEVVLVDAGSRSCALDLVLGRLDARLPADLLEDHQREDAEEAAHEDQRELGPEQLEGRQEDVEDRAGDAVDAFIGGGACSRDRSPAWRRLGAS